MPTTHPAAEVLSRLRHPSRAARSDPSVYEIDLAFGERAWNPASTKGEISGPATVRYEAYRDGGINVTVTRP